MNEAGIARWIEHPAFSRALPFAAFMLFIAFGDVADYLPAVGLDARWWLSLRAFVVALLLMGFWKQYVELWPVPTLRPRDLAVATGAGLAIFYLWIHLDISWAKFGIPGIAFAPTLPDGSGIDWTQALLRLFGLALVVPVMEELFWRSFLLRWIDQPNFLSQNPGRVSIKAIAISSLLFASEHHLWLAGLVAGVVYALVYIGTRNLWLPIICHAVTNTALGVWILATGNWQFW